MKAHVPLPLGGLKMGVGRSDGAMGQGVGCGGGAGGWDALWAGESLLAGDLKIVNLKIVIFNLESCFQNNRTIGSDSSDPIVDVRITFESMYGPLRPLWNQVGLSLGFQ